MSNYTSTSSPAPIGYTKLGFACSRDHQYAPLHNSGRGWHTPGVEVKLMDTDTDSETDSDPDCPTTDIDARSYSDDDVIFISETDPLSKAPRRTSTETYSLPPSFLHSSQTATRGNSTGPSEATQSASRNHASTEPSPPLPHATRDSLRPRIALSRTKRSREPQNGSSSNVRNVRGPLSPQRTSPTSPASTIRPRSQAKGKEFRLSAIKVFLTVPQSKDLNKDTILSRIRGFKVEPKVAIVCVEAHQDGTPHIHCYIEFTKKLEIRNPKYFDSLWPGFHCNISTVRNVAATLQYITKDDDYVIYGITQVQIDVIIEGTHYKLADVVAEILVKPYIHDIAVKFPTTYVRHHQGLNNLCEMVRQKTKAAKVTTFPWPDTAQEFRREADPERKHNPIVSWMLLNLRGMWKLKPGNRPRKTPQLWIWGPPNTGKTYFLDWCRQHWRCYEMPHWEKYMDSLTDEDYDICIFDEFSGGQQRIQFMNTFLEGAPMTIPKKGSQYAKTKNFPVIICSNLCPTQCYRNIAIHQPMVLDALLSRLTVVRLDKDTTLFPMVDALNSITSVHLEAKAEWSDEESQQTVVPIEIDEVEFLGSL